MKSVYKTEEETKSLLNQQVFLLENSLMKNHYSLTDVGELVPGSIMVQDMKALQVTYMNNWGCEALNHSMEEIKEMGKGYYEKFFLEKETRRIMPDVLEYFNQEDNTALYSFFQQVRTGSRMELRWYYTVCKFLRDDKCNNNLKLIFISNPVSGMGLMVNKVNKLLDENIFVAKNYKKFVLLTKREKEIISFLGEGKTTNNIANTLFISPYTVSTHRKNISSKLNISSFSELLKFAAAFELIK